jgi:hypothetical protein
MCRVALAGVLLGLAAARRWAECKFRRSKPTFARLVRRRSRSGRASARRGSTSCGLYADRGRDSNAENRCHRAVTWEFTGGDEGT